MPESYIELDHHEEARMLFGARDENLRRLREQTGAQVVLRGNQVRIRGEDESVRQALELLLRWRQDLSEHPGVAVAELPVRPVAGSEGDDRYVTRQVPRDTPEPSPVRSQGGFTGLRGGRDRVGAIRPMTAGQKIYMEAMQKNDLVFCDGPAGSGKTYLAVASALVALRAETVRKIVLVRPAVEAGEKLGFLPGDLFAKVNPFVRPLLDALHDMVDYEQVRRLMSNDVIEILPLAFMRGRTLNETFMILDEAQNTTVTQMKMFLTRMGQNSRIVVTGDSTQNDLDRGVRSGFGDAIRRLSAVSGVASVGLSGQDIVRHRLVREIVSAYETSGDADQSSAPGES